MNNETENKKISEKIGVIYGSSIILSFGICLLFFNILGFIISDYPLGYVFFISLFSCYLISISIIEIVKGINKNKERVVEDKIALDNTEKIIISTKKITIIISTIKILFALFDISLVVYFNIINNNGFTVNLVNILLTIPFVIILIISSIKNIKSLKKFDLEEYKNKEILDIIAKILLKEMFRIFILFLVVLGLFIIVSELQGHLTGSFNSDELVKFFSETNIYSEMFISIPELILSLVFSFILSIITAFVLPLIIIPIILIKYNMKNIKN